MRIKQTLLLGLAFLLSGCSLSVPTLLGPPNGEGSTPEEAVLAGRPVGQVTLVQNIEVLGTRDIGARKVVLYRVRERSSPFSTRTMLGFDIVEPDGVEWKVVDGPSEVGVANEVSETQLLDYGGGMRMPPDERTDIFGQAFETVTKVEATLGNGDIVSDEVTNGGFAIISPVAAEVCEVRALDANGAVLKTISQIDPAFPVDPQTPNPCPR
jgi:hypothetical protein